MSDIYSSSQQLLSSVPPLLLPVTLPPFHSNFYQTVFSISVFKLFKLGRLEHREENHNMEYATCKLYISRKSYEPELGLSICASGSGAVGQLSVAGRRPPCKHVNMASKLFSSAWIVDPSLGIQPYQVVWYKLTAGSLLSSNSCVWVGWLHTRTS